MSSAIKTPAFQAKAGSIQNQADTSAVYSDGEWSFKNSSAVARVTIKDDGNCAIITTGANYVSAGGNGGLLIQDSDTGRGLITLRGGPGNFQGLQFSNTSGTQTGFGFLSSSTAQVGYVSDAGAWTLGPPSGLTSSHIIRSQNTATIPPQPTLQLQNAVGSAQLKIQAANATSCNADILLECPGSNAGGMYYERVSSRLWAWSSNKSAGSYIPSGGTAWLTGSDLRLKNIVEERVQGLDAVLALNPIKYTRKAVENDSVHLGFIAQEVLPHIPEIVEGTGTEEDMYGISYSSITPVLVKAIQELSAKVDAQAAEIEALKAK